MVMMQEESRRGTGTARRSAKPMIQRDTSYIVIPDLGVRQDPAEAFLGLRKLPKLCRIEIQTDLALKPSPNPVLESLASRPARSARRASNVCESSRQLVASLSVSCGPCPVACGEQAIQLQATCSVSVNFEVRKTCHMLYLDMP